ncbi:hypothetical protein AXG93_2508s1160 [Marchantia polymorpha subsp. ruderalis]|uniref:Uncharacterized protein n=1 Tax=Marchantia polymorpha subsp. ruderalis TaxID=1480154 RepID=A0A176WFN0_MARPO|nr:hypothetical protein AXG93_2508s1160 [Marchantia polymorpha subsp. ruderalis]
MSVDAEEVQIAPRFSRSIDYSSGLEFRIQFGKSVPSANGNSSEVAVRAGSCPKVRGETGISVGVSPDNCAGPFVYYPEELPAGKRSGGGRRKMSMG